MSVKKLIHELEISPRTLALTNEQTDLLVREADASQLMRAVMCSSPTPEQKQRIEARLRELKG